MGLKKFKSLKDAREAMIEELICGSLDNSHEVMSDEPRPNVSTYKCGLYRFKTWEEAHKYDMESMIRRSCRRKAA